ncbi:MAG: hypothetical protein H7A37_02555 [Chlamydiales bacterium]|nr:hypothetical protein [Chlamydiia bacterium]MCP5507170.1 hypothetical protein [Chlamydiales bacterium]
MNQEKKMMLLKIALMLIGLFFIFGIFPAMYFLPESWAWSPHQPEYEQMIIGVYATLGVFLLLAARNPMENRSLIWFTVWSSIVHGGIMLVQAVADVNERANLHGDIPALLLVGLILGLLMPRKQVS